MCLKKCLKGLQHWRGFALIEYSIQQFKNEAIKFDKMCLNVNYTSNKTNAFPLFSMKTNT
jgi:hypothetical protein